MILGYSDNKGTDALTSDHLTCIMNKTDLKAVLTCVVCFSKVMMSFFLFFFKKTHFYLTLKKTQLLTLFSEIHTVCALNVVYLPFFFHLKIGDLAEYGSLLMSIVSIVLDK